MAGFAAKNVQDLSYSATCLEFSCHEWEIFHFLLLGCVEIYRSI